MDSEKVSGIEPTINSSMNNESEFLDFQEKKNKKKGLIISLVVIFIVLLLVVFALFFVKNNYNAEKFLDTTTNKLNNRLDKFIDTIDFTNMDKLKEPTNETGKIKFETNSIELRDLNNIALEYDISTDYKNKYHDYDLTLTQGENASINLGFSLDNKRIYLRSKDLTDKEYYIDMESDTNKQISTIEELMTSLSELSDKDNIKYIIKSYLNSFNKALKISVVSTKYNGLNAIYTYEINDSNKEKIENTFIESIKSDKKLMDFFEYTEDDLNDIKESFDNCKVELTINMLNGNLKEFKVTLDDNTYHGEKINDDKYKITVPGDNNYLEVEYDNEKIGFTYYENNKSTDQMIIEGTNDYIKVNYSYDLVTFDLETTENTLKANLKTEGLTANADFKFETGKTHTTSGTITVNANGDDIKLIMNNTSNFKDKITKKDVSGATNFNDITDEEMANIISVGYEKLQEFDVMYIISGIAGRITANEIINTCKNMCPNAEVSGFDEETNTCKCTSGDDITF